MFRFFKQALVQSLKSNGNVGIDYNDDSFKAFINRVNIESLFKSPVTSKELIDYIDKSTLAKIEKNYIVSKELYESEINIATNIKRILHAPSHIHITGSDIDSYASDSHIVFDADQINALKALNSSNIVIIQGPAGTGKSYLIKSLIKIFTQIYPICEDALVTPTGKAARVYRGIEATTIHKLLGFQYDKGFSECRYTSANPIPAELIVVDEASMVDINAAKALFDAVANGTKVVLVGDSNQLLPVEEGQIFRDLITSGKIHTVYLSRIFRTESKTIIDNANRILDGKNTFIIDSSFRACLKNRNNCSK